MKALMYYGPRDIRCEAVSDPIVSDRGAAIVKVRACGICGSDLHPYHVSPGWTGYCIGHEAVGEVVETGPGVARFKVGDRVLIAGSVSCGSCSACRAGYAMQCERTPRARVFGQGMFGIGGCQAEAVEVPVADANLHALPAGMSDELGLMLTDTLPTAWHCAKKGKVAPGKTVAVIGLGAVGLQCVLTAFAMGAQRVFAIDLLEERRAAAAELGATPLAGETVVQEIMDATSGLGVDSVLDATGGPQTMQLALEIVRKGGSIAIVGISEEATIPFPVGKALSRNVDVALIACSVQAQLPEVLAALEDGRLNTDQVLSLITHRMPLSAGAEAYALFDARRDGVKKIVLTT